VARVPEGWEGGFGATRIWLSAPAWLRRWAYSTDEGGGAFYGPKIDIKIRDAMGRLGQ